MLRDPERCIARAMWGVTIGMVVIHDRYAELLLAPHLKGRVPERFGHARSRQEHAVVVGPAQRCRSGRRRCRRRLSRRPAMSPLTEDAILARRYRSPPRLNCGREQTDRL